MGFGPFVIVPLRMIERRPPGTLMISSSKLIKMSSHLCFCCLCKGEVAQSSHRKTKQHVALYSLWHSERAAGPSTAKKSRANATDSDDSSSDSESEKLKNESAAIVEEAMCVVDEDVGEGSHDDHSTNFHEDQNDNDLVLLASDPENLAKVSLA